ncbi:hypothetical protein SAMN03159496_03286 [Rhizobium sp. NFR07]|nr:hypothetical protein [Rhizobium sp. NFR07]SFB38233.1 hypothetical protein SAMN03159496_03286 [Rhizobium sp. NFR07]
MLYVFSSKNGVQIAWNSEVPRASRERRPTFGERLSTAIGFIRTSNLG